MDIEAACEEIARAWGTHKIRAHVVQDMGTNLVCTPSWMTKPPRLKESIDD
jgi:hypothetical protein